MMNAKLLRAGVLCVMLLTFAGCASPPKKSPAKEEAKVRWEQMRAKVKYQLADRNFETGQVEDALKLCQEVISLNPSGLDAYLLMSRIQLEKGQIADAEAALDAAAGLGQAAPELDYMRGMLAERREQRADAAGWYQRAYEARPNEPDYLLAYAESLLANDRLDLAVDLLSKRQQDFEQDVRVQTLAGQALAMVGRYREASDAYLSVVRLAPAENQLREEAGLTLVSAGRLSEAQAVLQPLLNSKDDKPSVGVVQALAAAMLEANQPQQAVALMESVAGEKVQSFSLWLLLGKAYLMSDRPAQAENAAKRACQLKPESAESRLLLAYAAFTAGDREQAVSVAQQIIAANPNDTTALSLLEQAAKLKTAKAEPRQP